MDKGSETADGCKDQREEKPAQHLEEKPAQHLFETQTIPVQLQGPNGGKNYRDWLTLHDNFFSRDNF